MSKLIIGFVLGVTVTISAFTVLGNRTDEVRRASIDLPAANENSGNDDLGIPINSPDGSFDAADIASESLSDSTAKRVDIHPTQPDLRTESSQAPLAEAHAIGSSPTQSEYASQNEYPPEIAEMIENRVDKALQARYESDEREESWATYMEGQLSGYFAQKPELAQFNFSLIDCRTTICEIHALGYGPDALTAWNVGTADIVTQSWHDFQSMSVNRNNPQPDVLGIVLILSRKSQ